MNKITVISSNCNADAAKDRTLPYNSYLVEYKDEENTSLFDIAITSKLSDLFDHYYDLYKKRFVKFSQTEGRVSPKLWKNPNDPKPKKGKKR